MKESDSRATPKWLMNVFSNWFDPCPLNLKPSVNGLELEWKDKTYVNPPYSNPLPWVKKAIEENKKGKTIALLLRLDTTTEAFRLLRDAGVHMFYCGERLRFIKIGEEKNYLSPFPSVLYILGVDDDKL